MSNMRSLRMNLFHLWQLSGRWKCVGFFIDCSDDLRGCPSIKTAVAVVFVMEPLEVLALPLERGIARKPLSPEKVFIIGVIEAFNDTIAPGFLDWDENRCDAIIKT